MSLQNEINCLKRLNELTSQLTDIASFLKEEKLIDDRTIKSISSSSDHPKEIQKLLSDLKKTDKLQLLEYQWEILPVERIKIIIITDHNQKEFCYN